MGEPGKFYLEIAQILQPPSSPPPPLPHVIKSTNYQIEKGSAGARFSKVPVTERTPKAVLFSFKKEGGKSKSPLSYTLKPPEVIHV